MEIEAWCGQCKVYRRSAVAALSTDGSIERVTCLYCNTSRNYRPPAEENNEARPQRSEAKDIKEIVRDVLREEFDPAVVKIADKWIGGKLILRPGRPGLQEKEIPIDVLFKKII